MKKTITITNEASAIELTHGIEKAYAKMNKHFFGGALPSVVITLSTGAKQNALGWMTCGEPWEKDGIRYTEINICSDGLNRSKVEVFGTLLHEMVHLYNKVNGIKDHPNGRGAYHNKSFKASAEKFGLIVEHSKKYGYAHTKPNEKTAKWIEENIEALVDMKRDADPQRIKVKKISYKHVCPVCECIARTTKPMTLICADCQEVMIMEEA